MARYVSKQSSFTTNDEMSENFPTKTDVSQAAAKRTALTTINGNFPKKEPSWKCNTFSSTAAQPEADVQKFAIFEDSEPSACPVIPKAPALSRYASKLITYDSKEAALNLTAKENKFSWSVEVPTRKLSEREKEYLNWSTPHISDIYTYLRINEKKNCPRPNYMAKQQDITLSMRSVLVDWLVEVGEEYKLHSETLHLAVSYTDRFLSNMSVLRGKLQLVGTACMFISSKYEEIYPPELKDFVYITDDTYTKKQILRMEHLVLKILDFTVATPTRYTFLELFCCMFNASDKASYLAQYICELSLLEADPFLTFLPSEIAAGSLALANLTLGGSVWSEEMTETTGYGINDLNVVIMCLHKRHSTMSSYPQQSIPDKYKSSKFLAVSEISPIDELML